MEENELMPVSKDLGLVTAYGYAKEGGFEGTEEEFDYAMAMIPEAFRRLGEPDFSTTLNSVKLKIGEVGPNQTLSFDFVNHSDRQKNSNNFVLIFGSNQYFRPDNYSWGSLTVSDSDNNWNMDRFRRDIDGARVHAEVENHEGIVKVRFDVVTKEGSYRYQWYELAQTINEVKSVVLTVDHSYADVFTDLIRLYDNSKSGGNSNTTVIGKKDFSTELQQPPVVHSTPITVPTGYSATVKFRNHSDKVENWHSAIVVISDTIAVKAYLRLDNFGWGSGYDGLYSQDDWDWTTFKDDIDGALVEMTVSNFGSYSAVEMLVTTEAGKQYRQFYRVATTACIVYLTVDCAYIDVFENLMVKRRISPRKGSIYLGNNWIIDVDFGTNKSRANQSVSNAISGIVVTKNSKIDLQPTFSQLEQLIDAGVQALYIANNNGSLTAWAIGGYPSSTMTIQCTVTEIEQ